MFTLSLNSFSRAGRSYALWHHGLRLTEYREWERIMLPGFTYLNTELETEVWLLWITGH